MNPHHSKEQESVKPPASPQLCANNCGFFANPACSNMCSKCYQDSSSRQHVDMAAQAMATSVANKVEANLKATAAAALQSQQGDVAMTPVEVETPVAPAAAVPVPSEAVPPPLPEASSSEPAAAVADTPMDEEEDKRPVQKNPNRCFECNKRVGYTGFTCRCGYIYCGTHRYAEKHNCTHDYKTEGRQRLANANPLVVASKVHKI
mmetsp:Transcript_18178/g.46546  ORF Transcript_18178/g.46546 Transcript_18178/m.46546 type:complete len:205 (-) Transcript_18178:306-920(-)|eukprot:jgi/Tetstr1/420383/TSEL_011499.t1